MSLPGFLTFLADTVLVQIIFKTILIEEITSNELFRIILKIITTFISIALIISLFVFDTHSN